MEFKNLSLIGLASAGILSASCLMETKESPEIEYPETKKVNQVDNYHGTEVEDPYRWLEIDTAAEVEAWVDAQNEVTQAYLSKIPSRDKIETRLSEIYNYERYSSPSRAGEYYFFYKNDGLQNQSVIYRQKGLDGEPSLFLDPNKLSDDGTVTASLAGFSDDKKYVSIRVNRSGSDWTEFYVREVATGKELSDQIKWAKFTGTSWYKDGFFYSSYGIPEEGTEYSQKNEFHKVYYHKLGTPQAEDELIWEDPKNALRNFYAYTTEDDRFLVVSGSEGTYGNSIRVRDLVNGQKDFTLVFPGFDYEYSVVDHVDDKLLVYTNHGAANFHLILVDPLNPSQENWEVLIPEKDLKLDRVSTAGNSLIAFYLKDVASQVIQYNYAGDSIREINLPDLGSAGGFGGYREDTEVFYTFASYLYPPSIFRYNLETGESSLFKTAKLDVDLTQFETKRVFYKSKDGTKVPLFIVHKKGMKQDGNNPTLLYGYGGFSINITPRFSPNNFLLLEQGGIYAVANLRGGTEYGEAWHKAGMLMNKQNVFDDFIAAAEYLIDENYTSKEKLGISGRSNGGLLVGACMTQRPELYQVAFPAVGVLDMLRYHKFTIGWAWASEYGSSDDPEHFRNLFAYSPYHNLEKTKYPSTMITTADHDDRVVPAHSFKFAARLQEMHTGNNPVLIRIDKKAGHGAGKPIEKVIEENADIWSFFFNEIGHIYSEE